MKKLLLLLMTLVSSPSVFSSCGYTLDASSSRIAEALGSQRFPVINIAQQLISFNLGQSNKNYIATSHEGLESLVRTMSNPNLKVGDKALSDVGIFAIEYKINNFPSQVIEGSQGFKIGYQIFASSSSVNKPIPINIVLSLDNRGTVSDLSATTGAVVWITDTSADGNTVIKANQTYPVAQPIDNSFRLGIYLNQYTKQIGFNLNGINKGYIATLNNIPDKISLLPLGYDGVEANSSSATKTVSANLITDGAKMSLTYPSGTKDICGNTI